MTILVSAAPSVNATPHPAAWPRASNSAMISPSSGRSAVRRGRKAMKRFFGARLASGLAGLAVLAFAASLAPAHAAEKLRVAKVVPFAWSFTPLDIGIAAGIFAKHGLDIEASASAGDAKLQQLLASGSIDIGIGSGPGMAFIAKGVPAKAVAAMFGAPQNMAVMVGYDSDIKTVADLKGKKLGCTTVGSLTDWIGARINQKEGWGTDGITTVPIGGMPPARAAIKTHQIDGYIGALETGYALEEAKEWRLITGATPFVDQFITHVIFATNDLIEKHPDQVKAFLDGWFETIAYMKTHKAETVAISAKVLNLSEAVISRVYDEQIGAFNTDGTFDPKAVAVLKKSYIEMGLLKDTPDDKEMFTTQFVPVKVSQQYFSAKKSKDARCRCARAAPNRRRAALRHRVWPGRRHRSSSRRRPARLRHAPGAVARTKIPGRSGRRNPADRPPRLRPRSVRRSGRCRSGRAGRKSRPGGCRSKRRRSD